METRDEQHWFTWKPLLILPPRWRMYFIISFPFPHMLSLFSMKNLWNPILFFTSVLKVEACKKFGVSQLNPLTYDMFC